MGMAVKVRMLLAARQMTLKDLGARMDPPTSAQNIGRKIKNEGVFILNDTGKEIR